MTSTALWIGSVIAFVIGLAHALYVYRQEIGEFHAVLSRHPFVIRCRAGHYALWTLVLWLLLGATAVVYWLLALVPYLIAKLIRAFRAPRAGAEQSAETPS